MSGKNRVEKVSEIDAHVSKQYNIVRRLGKGAYGIVWKAVEKKSKEIVAVKKIFEAFRNQTDAQRTFREIMFLLSFANHENIIRLIGLHKANNDRDIYLVFEYMETDLHIVIKKGNILMDIHKVFIMYQLFKAIKYIHSGNVIHRDLKPSNVLLNAQCHCKIADFGLARSVTQIGEGDGETGSDPTLTDYVATRWYRAPEILVASKRYTKGIDMWSLGCILGEMLLGEPLFPGSSTINQVEIIMATLPPPTREDLISVSAGYGTNLLEKTPNGPRRSLRDLLPEVSEKALDLISSLIVFNPTHRLTAVEALEHPYVADFHRRSNEPERGSSVIPLLRDDVQLSVDEYRNKLYAMMDGKHRKHEMMSRSRIKRLSEHIRKETAGRPAGNPVIGQGDGVLSKSVAHRRDDLRAIKKDGTSKPEATGTTPIPSRKTIRPSQIDSDERTAKTRTINLEYQQADPKNHHRPNTKSVATQYNYNLTNGNARNVSTPGPAKSCPYLNQQQQQQQLSKSQRSIQSDQAAAYGRSSQLAAAGRAKLRRGCRQSRVPSEIPYAKDTRHQDEAHQVSRLGHDRLVRTRMFPKTGADTTCCHYSTKNNTATGSAGGNNSPGSSSHASCHSAAQSQAVRNYLNQTIPSRRQPPKVDEQRYARGVPRNSLDNRAAPKTTESRTFYSSGNPNGPKGDPRNQQRSLQRFLDTDTGNEKKSGRRPSCLNSYNQSRGVIAASAYKDLRNGTIRW